MKYIDVRLRIPLTKMGLLVDALPEWAAMVGYDKLEAVEREVRREGKPRGPRTARGPNGEYKPSRGSARQDVMRVLGRGNYHRHEIISKLHGKQKVKAVSSAIHALTYKGLIRKQSDGSYGKV